MSMAASACIAIARERKMPIMQKSESQFAPRCMLTLELSLHECMHAIVRYDSTLHASAMQALSMFSVSCCSASEHPLPKKLAPQQKCARPLRTMHHRMHVLLLLGEMQTA